MSEPRFMQANVTNRLPEYTNDDQDRIKNAFLPTWQSLSSLPDNLQAGYSHSMRIEAMEKQAMSGQVAMKPGMRANRVFMDFEYQPSPYELADEAKAKDREAHDEKMTGISDRPFVGSGKTPGTHTSMAKTIDGKGHSYLPEPFDAIKDEAARRRWLEDHKVVGGPFVPSGTQKALNQPTRGMLTEVLTQVYKLISDDWEELRPTVHVAEDDFIVVYYRVSGMRSTAGITAYMNVMANRNEIINAYRLQRVPQAWNVVMADGTLVFAFKPPWVRNKELDPSALTSDVSGKQALGDETG